MLNDLINLVQQVESFTDEAGEDVQSIFILGSKSTIYIQYEKFLSEFQTFDVQTEVGSNELYSLMSEIDGIEIRTLLSGAAIVDLKEKNASAWEFIQREIQKELS